METKIWEEKVKRKEEGQEKRLRNAYRGSNPSTNPRLHTSCIRDKWNVFCLKEKMITHYTHGTSTSIIIKMKKGQL